MKIIPSVLLRDLSGRVAHAVARKTRGVQIVSSYNRRPRDPATASQLLARASLAMTQKIYAHMVGQLRAEWEALATGRLPGLNLFARHNVTPQIAEYMGKITPPKAMKPPPVNVRLKRTWADHADCLWNPGNADPNDNAGHAIWVRQHPLTPGDVPASPLWRFQWWASALSITSLTGQRIWNLQPSTTYRWFVFTHDNGLDLGECDYMDFTTLSS